MNRNMKQKNHGTARVIEQLRGIVVGDLVRFRTADGSISKKMFRVDRIVRNRQEWDEKAKAWKTEEPQMPRLFVHITEDGKQARCLEEDVVEVIKREVDQENLWVQNRPEILAAQAAEAARLEAA